MALTVLQSRPASGLDCLICAILARHRYRDRRRVGWLNTRQEDLEVSPTQSHISPSKQRILRQTLEQGRLTVARELLEEASAVLADAEDRARKVSHTHSLSHSLTLSLTHSLTHSLSLTLTLSLTHTLSRSLSHSHTHTNRLWKRRASSLRKSARPQVAF